MENKMYTIHEGEIIYKEKYGSFPLHRFYVKPPDQTNVVIHDEEKLSDITNLFTRIFMPQGYPNSVSGDYINYQIWDTAQAFCSTITGVLATQEVLRGVGVGDTTATPIAATFTWVLKDGCGHLGKILFAYSHGSYLDAYSKKWRLYADTLNDAAMCIEMALPVFKDYTTIILCISTMMKAIVGVAGGATRVAMTQHHAIRGNLADVSAKDSAQETAVNLIASITALIIVALFGNSLTIFVTMIVFHIIFNYFAVRAVCLRTLNEPRFLQVIDKYLREETIANPCNVNKCEPVVFYHLGSNILDLRLCGFQIKLGHSMRKMVKTNPKANYMKNVQDVYRFKEYILLHNIESRRIYVYLRESAKSYDILCAYFQAVLYAIVICAINNYPLPIYKNPENSSRPFAQICETLQDTEWSRIVLETPIHKFIYEPSFELMVFLNAIVDKEWPRLSKGLLSIGWDLQRNLLVVDEWRVCTAKLVARHISVGHNVTPEDISHDTNLMTFDEQCSKLADENVEVKAYTIEPDKQLSDTTDKNPDQDTDSNEARPEPKSMSAIPENRSSQLKQDTKSTLLKQDTKSALLKQDSISTQLKQDSKSTQLKEDSNSTQMKHDSKTSQLKQDSKSTQLTQDSKSTQLTQDSKSTQQTIKSKAKD